MDTELKSHTLDVNRVHMPFNDIHQGRRNGIYPFSHSFTVNTLSGWRKVPRTAALTASRGAKAGFYPKEDQNTGACAL